MKRLRSRIYNKRIHRMYKNNPLMLSFAQMKGRGCCGMYGKGRRGLTDRQINRRAAIARGLIMLPEVPGQIRYHTRGAATKSGKAVARALRRVGRIRRRR